jgi:DNA-binding GntR family transcriptional regulator
MVCGVIAEESPRMGRDADPRMSARRAAGERQGAERGEGRGGEGRRPNSATAVAEALEQDILNGVLRPGDRLDERALGERFGLSRTPIREALLQLAASGLATSEPRRGTVVAELTLSELIEMFEVMVEIEALAARLAARRSSPAAAAGLEARHAEAQPFVERGDWDGYYHANVRFHEALYAAARNGYLERQALALSRRLSPFRRLQLRRPQRLATSNREHAAIIEAVRAADPDRAAAVMRDHVTVQGEGLVDLFTVFAERIGAPGR